MTTVQKRVTATENRALRNLDPANMDAARDGWERLVIFVNVYFSIIVHYTNFYCIYHKNAFFGGGWCLFLCLLVIYVFVVGEWNVWGF